MREVKIIFHVGKQKTATSFIQKNVQSTSNLIYLGKLINNSEKNKFFGNINNIHSKIFTKYPNFLKNSFSNPSRNNYKLISEYAEQIIKLIKLNPEVKQVVISDECISDYYNHLGEHNLFLIILLGNFLSDKMKPEINLRKILSFTIRNQLDIIKSFYSYNLFINDSFDNFLDSIFENKYDGFSGSLFYFEIYSMFKLITNKDKDWNIKLTPYELLSIEDKPLLFIKEVLCLNENMINCIKKENLKQKVNVTKKKSKSNFLIKKQFTTPLYRYISMLNTQLKDHKNQFKKYTFYELFFKKKLLKILHFIDLLFMKLFSKRLIREYKLSNNSKNKIFKIYREDNHLLKKLLTKYELTKYGYF